MYEPLPDLEELKAFGLMLEDVTDNSVIEVWPENWTPYVIFSKMRTAWRVSSGGPVGLVYEALPFIAEYADLKRKKKFEVFDCLQVMEIEALNMMHKK